jgi:hypothetical protein
MLSGFIEYYKQPQNVMVVPNTQKVHENVWSKKYCEKFIEKQRKKGFVEGAKVLINSTKKISTLSKYKEIPPEGYKFYVYPPALLLCTNEWNMDISYRFEEITLIDTNTGAIEC